ncbi:uncharacterized protein LOC119075965 [Bradysia coprophila]|uniref:uncharacterized protein LOC119075965 n=1 Tax=Bradysia coprophila TaxID=38358 RepID=UPI00187D8F51|nr:uncharacterized protein LOC119075965 [Bradysia coprophila]
MSFTLNYLVATTFAVLLSSEIVITFGSLESEFDWKRFAPPSGVTDKMTLPSPKDFIHPRNETSDDFVERGERHKRDIRSDILENELQTVVRAYNSEITSQARTTTNSILSRSRDVNALRNLLAFSYNNLATSGLNDLSSMASKLPVTVQNCYNSYGFKFSDAITAARVTAGQCLANKINEVKSIVDDFRTSITDAVANVRDVGEQLGQCRILANLYPSIAGLIAKASCLNIAIFSLRGETVLLPLKFAILMGKAFNSIVTIQSDMTRCGLDILNTILDQSIQSGRAINNCINEQNGNGTLYTGSDNVINTTVPAN